MKNIMGFFFFTFFSLSLQAMLWKPLSSIEKQLIYREIQRHGIATIRQKVESTPEPKAVENKHMWGETYKIALKIEGVFYKNETSTDPLTQAIFDKIEKIEKEDDYITKQIIQNDPDGYTVRNATNSIGQSTRYYWLEENGKRLPAVRIEAKLYDKKPLLEVIDSYKE